jgi:hypothetical protein
MAPAAAMEFAESVARFMDAELLYRRVDDASAQPAGS